MTASPPTTAADIIVDDNDRPASSGVPAPDGEARPTRALGLQRFVGGVQVLGGVTLTSAYGLGAEALPVAGAVSALVVLGALQILIGIGWIVRPFLLRSLTVRRPGTHVALTLTPAVAVAILGCSGPETLYVTSTMCWLVAAGYALPGIRWAVVGVLATAVISAAWIAVEGSGGGFERDGHYATAIVYLASIVLAGLWLGRTTGGSARTIARWHLIESHEQGIVERLRSQLRAIDHAAGRVIGLVPRGAAQAEFIAMQERVRPETAPSDPADRATVGPLLDGLAAEFEHSDPSVRVTVEATAADGLQLSAATADALASALRRQWTNVVRHAGNAETVSLTAEHRHGSLTVRMEDDGQGSLPFRPGSGSAWSDRQLARVNGSARYFAGRSGVGLEVVVPASPTASVTAVPDLSVARSLDRFAEGMLASLRWAGYMGDTLTALPLSDEIGGRWLVIPLFALAIEAIIYGPAALRLGRDGRLILASFLSVVLTAVFAWPVDSPATLGPATTSVIVLATLIIAKQWRWWWALEALRLIAVAPLLVRHSTEALSLALIYPIGLSAVVFAVRRYMDRAVELERNAADAIGRSALAAAAVQGLSLRHDVVDVVRRNGGPSPELLAAATDLDAALAAAEHTASDTLDPRETVQLGLEATLLRDRSLAHDEADSVAVHGSTRAEAVALVGAIDRITLLELAALAADERATCAPPGLLGRRRLADLQAEWAGDVERGELQLTLRATPTLAPPEPQAVERLRAVAEAVGIAVESTPDRLTLTYHRS